MPRRASRPSRYDSTTSRLSLYDILVPARRPYKPAFLRSPHSCLWGVGLGQSASPSAGGQTSGPTLTALFFFFFFFLGGRAIHYTKMDMQRKKPQVSNGRPSTAEAASYPHYLGRGRHKSLQRGNMSGKTSSPQGRCSPAHSQACSLSTNKASPLSESTQHSCQDHNLKST